MSNIDLSDIAELLEHLGVKHAPEQLFSEGPGNDGRYVLTTDEPAVYYILGTDNADRRKELTRDVQIVFLDAIGSTGEDLAERARHIAGSIGYTVKELQSMPVFPPEDGRVVPAAILSPRF